MKLKNIDQQNAKGETSLHRAASGASFESVTLLLQRKNVPAKKITWNPVTQPSKMESKMDTKKPIGGKALPFLQTTQTHSVHEESSTVVSSTEDVTKIVTVAQVNISNEAGETPLHCAVKSGSLEIVTLLVNNGADLTVVSSQGTPIDLAKKIAKDIFQVDLL